MVSGRGYQTLKSEIYKNTEEKRPEGFVFLDQASLRHGRQYPVVNSGLDHWSPGFSN